MPYKLKSEASGSVLLGCLAVLAAELIWTMLSCMGSAILIEKGITGDENLTLLSAGIILVGSMLGAFTAMHFERDRSWLMSSVSAGLYFALLVTTNMMIFRGGMNGVLVTVLLIIGGTAAAMLLNTCKKGNASSFNRKVKLGKLYKISR